jgi:UDP-N-acetylmuramoylalanine--D-glutamate ligase
VSGGFEHEQAVVVGYGASGRAAATTLLRLGARVRVTEARPLEDLDLASGHERGPERGDLELVAGGHRPEHLEGATLVILSPGVPEGAPIVSWARQRGVPVWSEVELGARLCRASIVAVTGTNGKTTTVELLAASMRAAGLSARACGNVGYPFSTAALEPFDALAVEVSSFQLRFQESLHPRVSVLLNIAPDHLDWHPSFQAYVQAKARIHALQGPDDVHIGNRDDHRAARVSRTAPCPVRWFRRGVPDDEEVGVRGGRIVRAERGSLRDLGVPASAAASFQADAAAAAAAGLAFGLPEEAVREGLASFEPLPHRGVQVASVGGVSFVDDSKATNPHAALAALDGRSDVVLIAGGLAKGLDLSPLASAAGRLRGLVAIGQAAPALVALFGGRVAVRVAATLEEAVEVAFHMAGPGSTVLLAPACASQDMFRDYVERGERFTAAARALPGGVLRTDAAPPHSDEARRSHAQ